MKTLFCFETKESVSLRDKKNHLELSKDWEKFFIPRTKMFSEKQCIFDICLEQVVRTTSFTVPYVVSCLCNFIENYENLQKIAILNEDKENARDFANGDATVMVPLEKALFPQYNINNVIKYFPRPDDQVEFLKLVTNKLPCSALTLFEHLSLMLFGIANYEDINSLNNHLGIIFQPNNIRPLSKDPVSLEVIKNITHLVTDYPPFEEKNSLINEYGLFASKDTIQPYFQANRQAFPIPSTVMSGICLKPLRVIIPDIDPPSENRNDNDATPVLLIENSNYIYPNEIIMENMEVSSKFKEGIDSYASTMWKRRGKCLRKRSKDAYNDKKVSSMNFIIGHDMLSKIETCEKTNNQNTLSTTISSIISEKQKFDSSHAPIPKSNNVPLTPSNDDDDGYKTNEDEKNCAECETDVKPTTGVDIPSDFTSESETKMPQSVSWTALINCDEPIRSDHFGWPLMKGYEEEQNNYGLKHREAEAPLSPSAYRSYLSYQINSDLDINSPPSPPIEQEHFKISALEDFTSEIKQLTKKIHGLKKKLVRFDLKYEAENGYKPSHAEKSKFSEAKKLLNDLHKSKKELKALKETSHIIHGSCTSFRHWSNSDDALILEDLIKNNLDNTKNNTTPPRLSVEKSFEAGLKILSNDRKVANRPKMIEDMTDDQVKEEKLAIQKVLLQFESIHGKPMKASSERDTVRPLYDRYRKVKHVLFRSSSLPVKGTFSNGLEPIMEHETADFTSLPNVFMPESDFHEVDKQTLGINNLEKDTPSFEAADANIHKLPVHKLIKLHLEACLQKNHVRKILKEFEAKFIKINSRALQKADKAPMESYYAEYKSLRAKARLLYALIDKKLYESQ